MVSVLLNEAGLTPEPVREHNANPASVTEAAVPALPALVMPLDEPDAADPSVVGGKGANLALPIQAGFAVPPGEAPECAAY